METEKNKFTNYVVELATIRFSNEKVRENRLAIKGLAAVYYYIAKVCWQCH